MAGRERILGSVFLTPLLAVCGCASTPTGTPVQQQDAPAVTVYAPGALVPSQYKLVRRIWIDSWWRDAFWVPTFSSEADAIAAMTREAVKVGATGLVNVACTWGADPIRRAPTFVMAMRYSCRIDRLC
jgi:hypothetical protein